MFNMLKHQLSPSRAIINKHHHPISDTRTAPPRAGSSCPTLTLLHCRWLSQLCSSEILQCLLLGQKNPSSWLSFPRNISCCLGKIFLPTCVGAGQGEQLLAGNMQQGKGSVKKGTHRSRGNTSSHKSQPHSSGAWLG